MNWQLLLDTIVSFLLSTGVKILIALVIFIVGWKLINLFVRKFEKAKLTRGLDPTLRSFLRSFISIGAKILLTVTVIAYLGVPMSSIIAAIASCGVAVGLALQGGLSNLAGGVMLLFMKPFKVGDFITAVGESGNVQSIGIFYTSLRTLDNRHVHIPNGSLMSGVIVNATGENTRRVDISCTAAYGCDSEKVRQALLSMAEKEEGVLKDPAPAVFLAGYRDSAIEYSLRVWCSTDSYWDVYFRLQEKIKAAFDEAGIVIPFPQVDVHFDRGEKQ